MWGYFSGLSSPSVTEMTTTLRTSPRSKSAGQTRLPTFSTNSRLPSSGCSAASARATIAASRWQPAPVLTWTARAPALRIRSASNRVSWSPSITVTGRVEAATVRSSSVVFPAPGELIRLRAVIRRSSSQVRLRAASSSFLASTATSRSRVWGRSWGCSCPCSCSCSWGCSWGWSCGWSCGWSWSWWWVGSRWRAVVPDPARVVTRASSEPQPHVLHISADLHRGDGQVTSGEHLDVGAAAGAQQDRVGQLEVRVAGAAVPTTRLLGDLEDRALERRPRGRELEAEGQRVRDHGGQPPDPQAHGTDAPALGAFEHRGHHALRNRQLVHVVGPACPVHPRRAAAAAAMAALLDALVRAVGPRGLAHPHGLDVGELPDPVGSELAAVAGRLDPAERQRGEGGHHAVDEGLARLEVADQDGLLVGVVRPGVRSEAEPNGVGDADRVLDVLGPVHLGDRPEHLLEVHLHVLGDTGEQRRRVPPPGLVRALPSDEDLGALVDGVLDELLDVVAALLGRQR